jgi:hypothetical protein
MEMGELGDIATRVVHEDDAVRIWEMRLEPGERSAPHRHSHDYVIVDVAGDRIAVEPVEGSEGEFNQYLEADVRRGQAVFLRKGGVEVAYNVGADTYRTIIVEFKD